MSICRGRDFIGIPCKIYDSDYNHIHMELVQNLLLVSDVCS